MKSSATLAASATHLHSKRKKDSFFFEIKKNGLLYLIALPGILLIFVFSYLPMAGIVIAFQNFNPVKGITGSEFVGLKNFAFFVQSSDTIKVIFNTLYLNVLFIGTSTLASIAIAIMLAELGGKWFKKISQTIIMLPHFLSWTVIAMFVSALLSTDTGMVNKGLNLLGLESIGFYSTASWWPFILVMLKLWVGAGFGSIVYLATISGINPDIYESASIDGASRWDKIRHITLPLLKPTVILLLLLAVGGLFNGDFGMIYAIVGNNPVLYPTTDVIDTYVYRALMELSDMSMAAAVGLFQSVVGFILVVSINYITRKLSPESALF
ncbi:ABC transporter permease [Paenibacillus sp. FA6]|uniref:ABC transporter permease n=1 Tax=Paenibacillus sp. FA6 TaxID=3413029 RepID=UPI003F656056